MGINRKISDGGRWIAAVTLLLPRLLLADTSYFFHWGSVDGNSELLRKGGYPTDGSYSNDLQNRGEAQLTEDLLDQTRTWYVNGGKGDAAGPGFYMSSNLTDSKGFGPDLLIVEVRTPPGAPVAVGGEDIRATSALALEKRDFSGLPLFSKFRNSWHVISRSIDPVKDPGVQIIIRPPRPDDEQRLWRAILSGQPPEARVQTIAEIGRAISGKNGLRSRGSDILLRRMFFDSGKPLLEKALAEIPPDRTGFTAGPLGTIVSTFQEFAPDDPRTSELILKWMKVYETNPMLFGAMSSRDNTSELMTWGLNRVSPAEKAPFLKGVLTFIREHNFQTPQIFTILPIYNSNVDFYSPQERQEVVKLVEDSLRNTSTSLAPLNPFFPAIEKTLGVRRTEELIEARHRALLADAATAGPRDVARFLPENSALLDYFAKKDPDSLKRAIARSLTQTTAAPEAQDGLFLSSLEFLEKTGDPELKAALLPLFKKRVEERVQDRRLGGLAGVDRWLGVLGNYQYFKPVLSDFPELSIDFRQGLLTSRKYFLNEEAANLTDFAVAQSKKLPLAVRLEAESQAAHVQSNGAVTREAITKRLTKVLQNIPGSQEYSELSRTFVLVDPDLASEDLMKPHTQAPWLRFNESFTDTHGKTMTQPAWENFNGVWDSFGHDLTMGAEAREAFRAVLPRAFYSANFSLLKGHVDGSNVSDPNWGRWDRKKYTTAISRQDWDSLKLGSLREDLSRYFEITESPDHLELKFHRRAELEKQFPKLRALSDADEPTALFLVIEEEVAKLKDPQERAARILYLFTKLHPYENGNGRLARLWAAQELLQAGYPMPVGFSRNDFFRTERETLLDVRKSVRLGKFWEAMITDAKTKGIRPEEFFQKVYRGSALEGLANLQIPNAKEYEKFVTWLETQDSPPAWSKALASKFEAKIQELRQARGPLAQYSEIERTQAFSAVWKSFQSEHADVIPNFQKSRPGKPRPSRCQPLFEKLAL